MSDESRESNEREREKKERKKNKRKRKISLNVPSRTIFYFEEI